MDGDLNLFRLLRMSNGDWMTVGHYGGAAPCTSFQVQYKLL
jgi:hypothetical protein